MRIGQLAQSRLSIYLSSLQTVLTPCHGWTISIDSEQEDFTFTSVIFDVENLNITANMKSNLEDRGSINYTLNRPK